MAEAAKRNARKSDISKWFRAYKESCCCVECGENHPACLEYHHTNPAEKKYNIFHMVKNAHSIESIKKELAKCVCICANCHRKLHWKY